MSIDTGVEQSMTRIAHLRNAAYRFEKARHQFALGASEMVRADIDDARGWDETLQAVDEMIEAVEGLIRKHTPTGKIDG